MCELQHYLNVFLKNQWIWIVKLDFHPPFLGERSVDLPLRYYIFQVLKATMYKFIEYEDSIEDCWVHTRKVVDDYSGRFWGHQVS
jgi:hypothetical protein